jgi:CubicO group peptidase (beta-lactamase class C family)
MEFAALLVLLFVSRTSDAQLREGKPERAGLNRTKLAKIEDVLRGEKEAGRISGAVTLVAREGIIADVTTVGLADLESKREMKPDTMFCIASMTKPITATALMMLVDEGKVSIDDPVSKYIPEFAVIKLEAGEPVPVITLRQLLTHTSGLHGDQRVEGSLEEHMQVLVERGLAFPPGTKWQYSPGLNVCGRVIEVVSGMPYHEFLRKRLFEPLRMDDTTFFPTVPQQRRLAVLYRPGEKQGEIVPAEHWLTDFSEERVANPSGGLISTAEDMAKFYQMILDGGTVGNIAFLSRKSVREMTRIQTDQKIVTGFTPGNGWGLGWCVVREPQGVTGMLSRESCGHGGAFGTQGWIDPERKMIFVLMIQRTKFGNSDGSELRKNFQQAAVDALKE